MPCAEHHTFADLLSRVLQFDYLVGSYRFSRVGPNTIIPRSCGDARLVTGSEHESIHYNGLQETITSHIVLC